MKLQKQFRIYLLAITFCGLIVTLANTILDPNIGKPTPFSFPSQVPLPQWQQQANRLLKDKEVEHSQFIAGKQYSYTSKNISLDIEARYLHNIDGDVQGLIPNYTSLQIPSNNALIVVRYTKGVGFYGLFTYNRRAYLSTCINPRGESTFTQQQFNNNHDTYDLQLARVVPWLLGHEELLHSRCLWTLLSTPSIDSSPEEAYQVLEKAWISWDEWWHSRFPKY
ncbi:MAG: hypothetical protein NVS2B14_12110 [Chamaesiphon sp.]